MYSNLVRPSGVDLHLQPAEFSVRRIQLSLHRVMADRFPSPRPPRGHAGAPHPVAADSAANSSVIALQPAVHQREIFFLDLPLCKLGGQPAMRFVALGHYDQAAGGLVQPMHDSRTQLAPAPACTIMPAGLFTTARSASS